MTKLHLYDIMQRCGEPNYKKKLEYLENYLLNIGTFSQTDHDELLQTIQRFKANFKDRWIAANNMDDRFRKNNENWLQTTITIPKTVSTISPGRPSKSFDDLSERAKRRKTENIRKSSEKEKLPFATKMLFRASGEREAANILQDITNNPECAREYRKAYKAKPEQRDKPLSPTEALSKFVEAGLSRKQYEIIRSGAPKTYPCYTLLQKVKRDCYPNSDAYTVTETHCEINLQDLLDHTTTRLVQYLQEVIDTLNENEARSLQLITKWGCDGSQQTEYKQKFEHTDDTDSNIFQSSMVPLLLFCGTEEKKKIIWQNPTPSSPRYCRPIRILFCKESADLIRNEVNYIQNKINSLAETRVEDEKTVVIKHKMILTMVDGKVCNAITNTASTMRCYICGATSKMFNKITNEETNFDITNTNFGLSILHARIRLFESLLHLSYKLQLQKWQIRSKEEKSAVETRKREIQQSFRTRMGILVDIPRQGFGNTNDGNTSRRFFLDPELSSDITGLDKKLIYRIKVILELISCGYKIDLDKFDTYARDTARHYIELYSWHPMSPTMHKILIHGKTIINNALLPIGQLSEEASEARNKHFRLYRLNYSRKFSRKACNMDVINRLLLSSDPIITGMRPQPKKRSKQLMKETLEMLLPPDVLREDQDLEVDELVDDDDEETSGESSSE